MIPETENKTQRLSLDLERNEDLAKLAADLEPGDKIKAYLSVVAVDEKTLTVELEEVQECDGDEASDDESTDQADESEPSAADDESPAMKMMRGKNRDEYA